MLEGHVIFERFFQKIVKISKNFVDHRIPLHNVLYDRASKEFLNRSSVRQGSIVSLLRFLSVMVWVMQDALKDKMFGIQLDDCIAPDLDFADDIALLEDISRCS